jgi:hypothetical protein
VTIEKLKLAKAHATVRLHALHLEVRDAEAQWAGGTVRGEMQGVFSPVPKYEVIAEIERVNLAQLPWPGRWAERWTGLASGKIHLTTGGVGKEELMKQLAGGGEMKLSKVEFRGWDVESSTESDSARTGVSRWTSGAGDFGVGNGELTLDTIQLDAPHLKTQLAGTITFGMEGDLTFTTDLREKRGGRANSATQELRVSGPLETPKAVVQPVSTVEKQP